MGFGFKVAPGVRVYPGGRGIGVGTSVGRVSYYQRVGGGRRSSGSSGSVAAYQRQVRAAEQRRKLRP